MSRHRECREQGTKVPDADWQVRSATMQGQLLRPEKLGIVTPKCSARIAVKKCRMPHSSCSGVESMRLQSEKGPKRGARKGLRMPDRWSAGDRGHPERHKKIVKDRQIATRQTKASIRVSAPLMGKRDRTRTCGDPPLLPSGRDGDGSGAFGHGRPEASIRFRAQQPMNGGPYRRRACAWNAETRLESVDGGAA